MQSSLSLTFFTVIMNRLHHLRVTLPRNLADNTEDQTNFLVLDYGSKDGLHEYLQETFASELRNCRLRYFKVSNVRHFDRCHSRNIAAKMSTGDIICNIDADNYTGMQFDRFLLQRFRTEDGIFLTGLGNPQRKTDAYGKLAVRKDDFINAGGYDETFSGYGFEDYDLAERLSRRGLRQITLDEDIHLQTLSHPRGEKISNEWAMQHLMALYTQRVDKKTTVLLFLYDDHTLEYGIVLENNTHGQPSFRFSLAGRKWQSGHWTETEHSIRLTFADFDCTLLKQQGMLIGCNHHLALETNPNKIEETILFNMEIANRYRLFANRERHFTSANELALGDAQTEKSFSHRSIS